MLQSCRHPAISPLRRRGPMRYSDRFVPGGSTGTIGPLGSLEGGPGQAAGPRRREAARGQSWDGRYKDGGFPRWGIVSPSPSLPPLNPLENASSFEVDLGLSLPAVCSSLCGPHGAAQTRSRFLRCFRESNCAAGRAQQHRPPWLARSRRRSGFRGCFPLAGQPQL